MTDANQLAEIRARIDALDDEILRLLNQRAACAREVAERKRAAGETVDFYRPEREAQILRRLKDNNEGPLPDEEVARLFREIMSACLALQRPLTVAFLGPEGTFTEAAALRQFGHAVETLPLDAIDVIFREVEAGSAHYGVVPVENSSEGVVNHTLDMFLRSPLNICGEVMLRVELHLLSNVADDADITRVYGHPQALAQCREWLDTNLPRAERLSTSSNAEAARRAAGEPGTAAVASEAAAERYGLGIRAGNIEDEPGNTTRFFVIGRQQVAPSGRDKTTFLISVHNRPGALYGLLEPLARHGVSMTRIESRPSRRGIWEYVFFVDVEGHASEAPLSTALAELEQQASLFRVLGAYPRAE